MVAIQDLLVDKAFLELDRQLNSFNIFDVLNLREYEIRHTRYLAARKVEELERELLSPELLASLEQVARLVEQAWSLPDTAA